ncbi:hypothetical protein NL676_039023 [Syzygium grande]|nr:hypothetical protein NL676_039023 [Syzygium grande]
MLTFRLSQPQTVAQGSGIPGREDHPAAHAVDPEVTAPIIGTISDVVFSAPAWKEIACLPRADELGMFDSIAIPSPSPLLPGSNNAPTPSALSPPQQPIPAKAKPHRHSPQSSGQQRA